MLGGAIVALLWISDGARAGFSAGQFLPVGVALAVTLASRVAVNVNRLSMHDFYRWRLAYAFAVTRQAAETAAKPDQRRRARDLFAQAAATRLSELRHENAKAAEPSLVVCGTANINAVREVPPGQGGFCVTFDADYVTLHREKGLKAPVQARARTSDYEALLGHRRSTLFDVSAISGAAISPLMGSATRHAYRILFTATNVRLGVWLPHPSVVRDARRWIDPGRRSTDAAVGPGTRCSCCVVPVAAPVLGPRRGPELRAGGPALGPCAQAQARPRRRKQRSGALWYRAMQPTLGLLWAEAAGRLSYRATWMYVTDGGHYDNLGLVEALRRGASQHRGARRLRRQGRHVVHPRRRHRPGPGRRRGGDRAEPDHDASAAGATWPRARWSARGRTAVPQAAADSRAARSRARSGSASSAGGPARPGTSAPTPSTIRPTPATAPWSSCTTPPSSRPTSSSARPQSWMRPSAAHPRSGGRPRRARQRLRRCRWRAPHGGEHCPARRDGRAAGTGCGPVKEERHEGL